MKKDHLAIVTTGLAPQEALALILKNPEAATDSERSYLKGAIMAVLGVSFIGATLGMIANGQLSLNEFARQIIDMNLNPANAAVPELNFAFVLRQIAQWFIYFIQSSVISAVPVTILKRSIDKVNKQAQQQREIETLKRLIATGEAPLHMPARSIFLDVGKGDSTANEVGAGSWGTNMIALSETSVDVSGAGFFGSITTPESDLQIGEFHKKLDALNYGEAGAVSIFPLKAEWAFLPDSANKEHFDLDLDHIIDRVEIYDNYCVTRKISLKPVVIVCDGSIKQATQGYGSKGPSISIEEISLTEWVAQKNLSRPPKAKIIIVDPTDAVLRELDSSTYNPDRLPLYLKTSPELNSIMGPRFVARCEQYGKMYGTGIVAAPDDTQPVLKVGYDLNDLATKRVVLKHADAVGIFTGAARALNEPGRSLIVSNVVARKVKEVLTLLTS